MRLLNITHDNVAHVVDREIMRVQGEEVTVQRCGAHARDLAGAQRRGNDEPNAIEYRGIACADLGPVELYARLRFGTRQRDASSRKCARRLLRRCSRGDALLLLSSHPRFFPQRIIIAPVAPDRDLRMRRPLPHTLLTARNAAQLRKGLLCERSHGRRCEVRRVALRRRGSELAEHRGAVHATPRVHIHIAMQQSKPRRGGDDLHCRDQRVVRNRPVSSREDHDVAPRRDLPRRRLEIVPRAVEEVKAAVGRNWRRVLDDVFKANGGRFFERCTE